MIPTDWVDMDSGNIAAIKYNPASSELYVHFKSGKMYTYYNVPVDVAEGFAHAPSPTQFLNKNIKGVYEYNNE